jgi:hypothetical protein
MVCVCQSWGWHPPLTPGVGLIGTSKFYKIGVDNYQICDGAEKSCKCVPFFIVSVQ